MHTEAIRDFVLELGDVEETFPFGETTLVFKTNNKMFLLLPLDEIKLQFNVKCDPEKALELREAYPDAVLPGFHMNKKHWNTMHLNRYLPQTKVLEFIRTSHSLIKK
jgi:predicted DNA-binding protein (MmcQ/YjbR family)